MPTVKKVQVKKKPVTDMQRDEMGRPVSPKQKSESLKGLQKSVDYKGRPKMQKGGPIKKAKSGSSLKPVDSSKNPGLAKLPTPVRNKMGYQKTGGNTKKKMMGGGKCKYGCK
jgi:hypothetical protein